MAALGDSLAPVVVGRALQGLAAGVIPLGISIMRGELPAERLGSATALMSASLGVGGALGLPAVSLLAERVDWHLLFWLGAVVAAVVPVAWGWWELRTPGPLVDLRTTVRRQVLLTNAASAVFGFSMFAMSLVSPQILQLPTATGYGLGQSLVTVGLVLAPASLVMMAMAPISARNAPPRP